MLYFFLLLLNIIPNLYAQKNFTSFQVSTIVVNSCENFIDNDYVSLNYGYNGSLNNTFLDNIRVKCTKDTNYNIKINNSEPASDSQPIISNIIIPKDSNKTLIELNSKIKYLRQIAANNSKDKSFYEVVNITISF